MEGIRYPFGLPWREANEASQRIKKGDPSISWEVAFFSEKGRCYFIKRTARERLISLVILR